MKYIGIDPGVELTGFAVVEEHAGERVLLECGVIRTERGQELAQRIIQLQADLHSILQRHTDADVVGIEELFFAKNAKTAFMVGQARGVILFTVAQMQFTIQEVKPVQVKQAVVGSGVATKQEVQRMIQHLFELDAPPQPDDAADAAAVALAAGALYRAHQAQSK